MPEPGKSQKPGAGGYTLATVASLTTADEHDDFQIRDGPFWTYFHTQVADDVCGIEMCSPQHISWCEIS